MSLEKKIFYIEKIKLFNINFFLKNIKKYLLIEKNNYFIKSFLIQNLFNANINDNLIKVQKLNKIYRLKGLKKIYDKVYFKLEKEIYKKFFIKKPFTYNNLKILINNYFIYFYPTDFIQKNYRNNFKFINFFWFKLFFLI